MKCCTCIAEKSIPVKDFKCRNTLLLGFLFQAGAWDPKLSAECRTHAKTEAKSPLIFSLLQPQTRGCSVQLNLQFTKLKMENAEKYSAFL